jgi:PST family polysaccharide transporter
MGMASLVVRPVNIIGTIVLARLLDPYDFGVVALGMLLASSLYLFVDLGMGPALIQTQKERGHVVFPAFVITMAFGALLTVLIIMFARPLAAFLGDDAAYEPLRWLALLVLLEAAITIPESLLRKDLNFGQVSLLHITQEALNMLISIVFAYLGYGFWSLVYGRLCSTLIQTVAAWLLCPGWEWLKPAPFDWQAIRQLLHYGIRSTGSGLMTFVHQNWDDWLVGRTLGASALGFYTKAYGLTNGTLGALSKSLVNGVAFPSYAQLQQDPERLSRAYLKIFNFVVLLMVPLGCGFFVVAPQLVLVLLGEKWLPITPVFEVFALLVLTKPISANTAPLFMAVGHPEYNFHAGIVLMVVMVPAVLLLLPYGITGVALGVVIGHIIAAAFNVYQVNRILPGTARATGLALLPPLVASVLMISGVHLAKPFTVQWLGLSEHNFVSLCLLVLLGATLYLGTTFVLQRSLLTELMQVGLTSLGGKRKRRQRMAELVTE